MKDPNFWHQRWELDQIGFHLDDVNPILHDHWSKLQVLPGSVVFVPLCGKSHDLLWLATQGYQVLGIEVSPVAVADFFKENKLIPETRIDGAFEVWSSGQITILCGDFFDLGKVDCKDVSAVYDRASLIAFPENMRPDYVEKLFSILPRKTPALLVTLDYKQQEMSGPPFAVSEQEVRSLYAIQDSIVVLDSQDVLQSHAHFKKKGLSSLQETVCLLT